MIRSFLTKIGLPLGGLLFIVIVSYVAHILFSSFGFVPGDDGFMLAYSRRIFDGQLPFRDFLSAQNIGTPLLFVPFIRFGGDYIFWITRYVVWFEFASIVWIWLVMLTRHVFTKKISFIQQVILALIAFFYTAHSFPTMVWYTIDGLFIYTIGLALCLSKNSVVKTIGYFLVGYTFLIKQNFISLLPGTIFLLGDWKSIKIWIAMLLPLIGYYCFFLFAGNLRDVFLQTTSRTEFVQTAIKGFTGEFTFPWGIILGFSGISLLKKNTFFKMFSGFLLVVTPLLYSAYYLKVASKFTWDASFLLFGALSGIILYFCIKKEGKQDVRFLLIALLISWCVAISGGYNTPALASGILFLSICILLFQTIDHLSLFKKLLSRTFFIILSVLMLITANNFYYTRTHAIYAEPRPANQLTYRADSILSGGKHIFISKEVYMELIDLRRAIKIAEAKHLQYAILPDYAGWWVQSKQANPLPMDYPFLFNSQPTLVQPYLSSLLKQKGKLLVIVDKVSLQQVQQSQPSAVYEIALFVPKHFKKIGETAYFSLYQ